MRSRGMPADRFVDRVDVQGDGVEEAVERLVLEEAGALHREVGAVELEHEPARDDQLVLLAHLAGERPHVALVRAVVRVEHDRGDDAGEAAVMNASANPFAPATERWKRSHSAAASRGPCRRPRPPPAARR